MNAADLLTRLDGVRQSGKGRWIACCPAHADKRPSLSIRELDDGRVLLHCFAGCEVGSIVSMIGLSVVDLFPPRPERYESTAAKRGIHPMDALHCVAHEARVVLVAGQTIEAGGALSGADLERLSLATRRIGAALGVCHV